MKKIFVANIEQLHPLLKWIRAQLTQMEFSTSTLNKIELASEEVFINIIHHAYQGREESVEMEIHLFPKSHIELVFKDAGPPFNPLDAKEIDSSSKLEEREVGGLGIHFIRQLIDEVRYVREGTFNILTLVIRRP